MFLFNLFSKLKHIHFRKMLKSSIIWMFTISKSFYDFMILFFIFQRKTKHGFFLFAKTNFLFRFWFHFAMQFIYVKNQLILFSIINNIFCWFQNKVRRLCSIIRWKLKASVKEIQKRSFDSFSFEMLQTVFCIFY